MSNNIHPTAIIYPNVEIGDNVTIGAYCIIGAPAEDKKTWPNEGKGVMIGDNVIITGHCTIDSGTEQSTKIYKDCFIMKQVHIGHDAQIGVGVTIAPQCSIGGHVIVHDYANIGMGTKIHQRCKIGAYSMVGMGAVVTKKTPIWPYGKFAGVPARHLGVNRTGEHLTGKEYWQIQQEWKNK